MYIKIRLKFEKKNILLSSSRVFSLSTPKLWKTMLFVSSRAFSLSTPVDNSEATWKKATKSNKTNIQSRILGSSDWYFLMYLQQNQDLKLPWREDNICFCRIHKIFAWLRMFSIVKGAFFYHFLRLMR